VTCPSYDGDGGTAQTELGPPMGGKGMVIIRSVPLGTGSWDWKDSLGKLPDPSEDLSGR